MAAGDFPEITPIQAIDRELQRLHDELESFEDPDAGYYSDVLDEISTMNRLLATLAKKEAGIA